MIEIQMAIPVFPGAREDQALANTDVVILVAEICVGIVPARQKAERASDPGYPRQRGQSPDIGQISGCEQDAMALAVGARKLAFELAVECKIAAEQPRIAVADAMSFDAANGRGLHAWACCDSEIVVGAERDLRSALHHEIRARETIHHDRFVRCFPSEPVRHLYIFMHATPPFPE